jgi:hypothetical protein
MSLFIQCILCQSGFLLSVYLGMRIKCDGYINLIFFSWHVQFIGDLHGRDRLVVEYAITCAITIKVVSSNSDHGEEYSIQHYVKKFVRSEVFPRYFGFQ